MSTAAIAPVNHDRQDLMVNVSLSQRPLIGALASTASGEESGSGK